MSKWAVGELDGAAHRMPLRVYYEDTDAGGVVYHANYLRFMERARSEMMLLIGADHVALARAGAGGYVVAEIGLRFREPARLGDLLQVLTRAEKVTSVTCVVHQQVMRDDVLLADGHVRLAFVGPDGRPCRQPSAWLAAFRAVTGAGRTE